MMLRIESVSYQKNQRYLIKDVSFSAKSGEIITILGANGAGKSTLMSMLSGERKPSSGRVMIDGKEISGYSRKELATKRAMLLQQNPISIGFSAYEVTMMGRYGKYRNQPGPADKRAVAESMEICGLNNFAERSMLTLSGGEQQRVHLARTLAQVWDSHQALIILDEPINNMDMQYQHQSLAIAKALAKKGFIVIMVLHDVNLAAQYTNRIIMMKDGRKWWDGAPAEVLTPQHMFTAFSVHALTHTDLRSLKTIVVPEEIILDASTFNTNFAKTAETEADPEKLPALRVKENIHFNEQLNDLTYQISNG